MITAKEARERYDVKHDPYTHKIDIFFGNEKRKVNPSS